MITISKQQARRFLLLKHGLLGDYRFVGKAGALAFVRQAGCIQFDPVDACGRNAELTLQSRVAGFSKQLLSELLYEDRQLIDYPDKNLSIFPVEDWPYFARAREASRRGAGNFEQITELSREAKAYIAEHGPVSKESLPIEGHVFWYSSLHWSGSTSGRSDASRSVLEQLYGNGELVIHHKRGTRKHYDLAEKHLPAELLQTPEPLPDDHVFRKWRALRRIGAVGLLWNRPSDAWLNIPGFKAAQRQAVFADLLAEGKLVEVAVDGLAHSLYLQTPDLPLLEDAIGAQSYRPRCECLAALDPMLWDRKLIRAVFDFDYTWEIYTPKAKRKYGYYVLPVLFGENIVGRIDAAADTKEQTLTVHNLWFEEGVEPTAALTTAIADVIERLAKFNRCTKIRRLDGADYGTSTIS